MALSFEVLGSGQHIGLLLNQHSKEFGYLLIYSDNSDLESQQRLGDSLQP